MASDHQERVSHYYDGEIYEAELRRLPLDFPVEREITLRFLKKWVAPGMSVAEIGVGGGIYSEWLVQHSCRVHLVDISRQLLETVAAKIGPTLLGATCASATNLAELRSGGFDSVLLLGPLYHLLSLEERRAAVREATRILKPGGILLAAGINRVAYLRELFQDTPAEAPKRVEFHLQFLRDGNLDPEHAPPIGYAHLSTIKEFADLFREDFEQEVLAGVESFTAPRQKLLNAMAPDVAAAWLDLVEQTCQTSAGLGHSDHFLFIGRRKSR